ncbi:MAG: MotA/TolQ/ExbB proton channel family protein [Candidatus Lambdaproteobacteria bacterium]|nr:MotA/TolQ/ExbB proton channel family protein [Candidatus Lambdaproteobacteria bacterium]
MPDKPLDSPAGSAATPGDTPHADRPAAGSGPAGGASAGAGAPPAASGPPAGAALSAERLRTLPPDRTATDNVDLLKSLFLGVLLTAVVYEVFPLPFVDPGRVLQVFDNRVSEVIVAVTAWALFLLGFKWRRFRRQARGREMFRQADVRAVFSQGVYARDVDRILLRLHEVLAAHRAKAAAQLIVYRRVFRVLQYIRTVPKKEGINDQLDYQSQIDLKKLESGYTILQVAIWAIPILGFIGTVLGIGEAVSEFSVFIQTAETGASFGNQMRTALGGVTTGLAVAFNTTFLALVLVIPVMVLTSILHKAEETLLLDIEEYCIEHLLPYLHVTPASAVHENYEEHLHRIIQLSNTWLGEFEPLVKNLATQSEMLQHQMSGIQPLIRDFTDRLAGASPEAARERGAESGIAEADRQGGKAADA